MASQIAPKDDAPDDTKPERRAMTPARKRRIWEREGGKCWMCGRITPKTGPGVVYDHKKVLWISRDDSDDDIFPLHAEPCNRIKTAADQSRIAKTKRLILKNLPKEQRPQPVRPLKGRGFPKSRWETSRS